MEEAGPCLAFDEPQELAQPPHPRPLTSHLQAPPCALGAYLLQPDLQTPLPGSRIVEAGTLGGW